MLESRYRLRLLAAIPIMGLIVAATPPARQPTTTEILAMATAAEWQQADPADLVLIELADGKRVTMMLAPDFAPAHVADIRALIRAHWFDDSSVYRIDRNFVVQWGQEGSGKVAPQALSGPAASGI